MPDKTAIEWTDATWNPTTGCTRVSDGCRHCYAEALSLRFKRSVHPWTKPYEAENVKLHPDRLTMPLKWKTPRRIFVDSMSDLFHELVPEEFIAHVFAIMGLCPQHTFQVLTKRPQRMQQFVTDLCAGRWDGEIAKTIEEHYRDEGQRVAVNSSRLDSWMRFPLPNVWIGTSVEDQRVVKRLDWLVRTPATVRFVSAEPLLGPLDLSTWLRIRYETSFPVNAYGNAVVESIGRVHWVITGGESGPHHRPFDPEWARSIRDQCCAAGVAYFHKQNGGRTPKAGGRLLDGVEWSQFPEVRA